MKKCVNVDCDYFKVYNQCASVCLQNGFKRTITNSDYIRSLEDGELSILLNGNIVCDLCIHGAMCTEPYNMSRCIAGVKEYLGQERKVDDGQKA